MSKKTENLIDTCIRILRKPDASEDSKDLAEAFLRAEMARGSHTQIIYETLPYRSRPWYPAWQTYCNSSKSANDLSAFRSAMAKHGDSAMLLAQAFGEAKE